MLQIWNIICIIFSSFQVSALLFLNPMLVKKQRQTHSLVWVIKNVFIAEWMDNFHKVSFAYLFYPNSNRTYCKQLLSQYVYVYTMKCIRWVILRAIEPSSRQQKLQFFCKILNEQHNYHCTYASVFILRMGVFYLSRNMSSSCKTSDRIMGRMGPIL